MARYHALYVEWPLTTSRQVVSSAITETLESWRSSATLFEVAAGGRRLATDLRIRNPQVALSKGICARGFSRIEAKHPVAVLAGPQTGISALAPRPAV